MERHEVATRPGTLVELMAAEHNVAPEKYANAIMQTCFPKGQASPEQLLMFLAVAHQHGLNPWTKEIYAFPTPGGGIQPVVGIDGWLRKMNEHPQFIGIEYSWEWGPARDGGRPPMPISCTATIYRQDRERPTIHTEWLEEAQRDTDPWKKMPRRMLCNRSTCQVIRRAFGFAGFMDPDEAEAYIDITPESSQMQAATATATEALKEKIEAKRGPGRPPKVQPTAQAALPGAPAEERKSGEPPLPPAGGPAAQPEPAPLSTHQAPVDDDLALPTRPAGPSGPIGDKERQELMAVLAKRFDPTATGTMPDNVRAAVRAQLAVCGYATTKDIHFERLPAILEWARTFNP